MKTRRGFVRAAGRLVHFRQAGDGPPVVLLHDSPRSSVLYLPLLAELAGDFTLFALDTPGYGESDPLGAGSRPEIDDFGDALAAALDGLGLERPLVYAYHTSSKIALSCAVRHPGRIGRLVIDGLSLPPQPTPEAFIEAYMAPFHPDDEGAYIARQWTRIRDLHRFFPWFRREAGLRLDLDEPTPAALHDYAMDLFMAAGHYSSAYSAAMRYQALDALAGLTTPTTFMARANDVLFPYLDVVESRRLPCAAIERLPAETAAWRRRLQEIFATATGSRHAVDDGPVMARDYLDLPRGQLHLRRTGIGGRTVLMLHDPPGSGRDVTPAAGALAGVRVLHPDLPGCGLSDPLGDAADCDAHAAVLAEAMDREDAGRFAIVASGLSVPIAVALARARPDRVERLWLDGMPRLGREEASAIAARYAPPIVRSREGVHFHAVWHRLRDEEIQWPWYDGSRSARRTVEPVLDAAQLHHRLVAVLQQPESYGQACRAALRHDLAAAVAGLQVPATFLDAGPDPRYRGVRELAAAAGGRVLVRADTTAGRLAQLGEWLED